MYTIYQFLSSAACVFKLLINPQMCRKYLNCGHNIGTFRAAFGILGTESDDK